MADSLKLQNNHIFDDLDQTGDSSSPPSSTHPTLIANPLSQQAIIKDSPSNSSNSNIDEDGFQIVTYNRKASRKDGIHNFQRNVQRKLGNSHQNPISVRNPVSRTLNPSSRNVNKPLLNPRRQFSNATVITNAAQKTQNASSWADLLKKGGAVSDFDLHYVALGGNTLLIFPKEDTITAKSMLPLIPIAHLSSITTATPGAISLEAVIPELITILITVSARRSYRTFSSVPKEIKLRGEVESKSLPLYFDDSAASIRTAQLVLCTKSESMTVIIFASFLLLVLLSSSSSSTAVTVFDEVSSLLQFKQSCIQNDPKGYLINWNTATSVCSWVGVNCSSYDNHIHSLNLSNMELAGKLNLDYVMALPKLVEVNLHGNFFYGSLFSTSASFSCNLKKIDVSLNHLSGSLHNSFFNVCHGLISLNLSRNSFVGGDLSFGSSLQELDLSKNQLSNIGVLKHTLLNCPELNHINLSDNTLSGRLPNIISPLSTNLTVLDLSHNLIYGEIPKKFISSAANTLRHLDLSHNNIIGNFSSYDFGDCKRISALDISSNGLNGNLPMSLVNCKLLETLALSSNNFSGQLPAFWSSFENLKHIHLADNNFQGKIPNELGYTCDTIVEIDLSRNRFFGEMPKTFVDCQFLERLNLSENQISGNFVEGVVSTISSLKFLHLSFNNLSGILPLQSLLNCTSLEVIDLSSNYYSGIIPTGFDFCKSLPSLRELLFAGNFILGKIPSEFGECLNLEKIDFSFNLLSGSIPSAVWSLPKVTDFIMWANKLEGEIPANICTDSAVLKKLILGYNDLSGTIPKSITNCRNMMWISLNGNKLTGKIPENIGNLKKLAVLQLEDNNLSGEIPADIRNCQSLVWLGLTNNSLSGPIPSEIGSQTRFTLPGTIDEDHNFSLLFNYGGSCQKSMFMFELQGIRDERVVNFPPFQFCRSEIYMGYIVHSIQSYGVMIYVDLSYNSLSGPIPSELGSMDQLFVLRLAHNKLTDSIPESIGGMTLLSDLDLSHNHLCGSIPSELSWLSFPSHMDVSYNNLTGPIPTDGQIYYLLPSMYQNNSGLCGLPLPPCSTIYENVNDVSDSSFGSERMFIDDGSLLSGFLFGLISSASIFSIVTNLR